MKLLARCRVTRVMDDDDDVAGWTSAGAMTSGATADVRLAAPEPLE